jgi:uncharacterized protein YdeI (YjbR/CyaY-like superfamily)
MSVLENARLIEPASVPEWRAWLEANHANLGGAWLAIARRGNEDTAIPYEAAIEEALCFGWVDGQAQKLDDRRTRLYFAPRKPRSGWARSNKLRVQRLVAEGRMRPAGMAAIERAKANGAWTLLDEVEELIVPPDLTEALVAVPPATTHWAAFPSSVRRQFLEWIRQARRPETRAKRIAETAHMAARNQRTRG